MVLQILRPKIEPIELVKIFGKKITNPWHKLTLDCSIGSEIYQPSSDEGMKLLLDHYNECLEGSRNVAISHLVNSELFSVL